MWKEIIDENDVKKFMEHIGFFHDGCIKELKYLSGAYVDEKLAMYPVNDRRILSVIIQRQFEPDSMIEMEFQGLKCLRLFPTDENYTCEILDSTLCFKDNDIYWCDAGNLHEDNLDTYEGTLICAAKLRWRVIEQCMGDREFYKAIK